MKLHLFLLMATMATLVLWAAMPATTAFAQAPVSGNLESEYRLGPADKVRIIVFGEEQLSGEFVVSGNGMIAMPLVGDIRAAGLTTPQFQTALQEALERDSFRRNHSLR